MSGGATVSSANLFVAVIRRNAQQLVVVRRGGKVELEFVIH
jgi:hypothetical protein